MWTVNTLITVIEQKVKSCQSNFMFRLNMSAHSQRRKIVCYKHCIRAVRYDDMYRMDEIISLSFHIMFYRLFRGVAKYIVYGNTFSLFE